MLKDLNLLAVDSKQRYTSLYRNMEIVFSPSMRDKIEIMLDKENRTISFGSTTSIVTVSSSQKIYLPNQWFVLASYFTEYLIELKKYKNVLSEIYVELHNIGTDKFWDYIKKCKSIKSENLNEQLVNALEEKLDENEVGFMVKFLTEYDWWNGSKTIDRTDYYVSPILNMLNVVNVNHSFIPVIVNMLTEDGELQNEIFNYQDQTDYVVETPSSQDEESDLVGINKIYYGGPGTGKSFIVEKEYSNISRVVFHSDYSYYDFVGSYKPVPVYKKTDDELVNAAGIVDSVSNGIPMIDYQYVAGPFIECVVNAYSDKSQMHTLLVEEINRGNAASIFGEMFQLLDRLDSGYSEYPIKLSRDLYNYLMRMDSMIPYVKDGYLSLPNNLNIVATMNSADQGVFVLDSAFKRRWLFEYVIVDLDAIPHGDYQFAYAGRTVKWKHFIKAINDKLMQLGIDEDRLIGPFFIKPSEVVKLENIKAKLFLYLWDDVVRHKRKSFFNDTVNSFSSLVTQFNDDVDVLDVLEQIESYEALVTGQYSEDESDNVDE